MQGVETAITSETEKIKERITTELIAKYQGRIQTFYFNAAACIQRAGIESQFLQRISEGNSVFQQMKDTQFKKEDLDLTNEFQAVRDKFFIDNKQSIILNELNTLIGEGYKILTEFGEQIRNRKIQYLITYISTSNKKETTLLQRVVDLKEFTDSFTLGQNGQISFGNKNFETEKTPSFISPAEWEHLLSFQEEMRKRTKKEREEKKYQDMLSARIQEVLHFKITQEAIGGLAAQQTGQDKYFYIRSTLDLLKKVGIDYKTLIESKTEKISEDKLTEIYQRKLKAVNSMYNNGRLIELGAALRKENSDFSSLSIDEMLKSYNEDQVPFYKQGDFTLKDKNGEIIEYQSKFNNATVNLKTIMNGLKELTTIFSRYKKKTEKVQKIGKEGSKKADDALRNDLVKLFTIQKK